MTPEIRGGSRALPQGMRAAILLCAITIASNTCATGGTIQIRTIAGGGSAANAEVAAAVPAFDEASYREIWTKQVGQGEAPKVDFSKEAVVFLFAGMHNTGGYSIEARGAKLEGDVLVVDAVVKGPPPGAIVTQVITYPFAVISVTPRGFRSVRWHETAQTNIR